MVLDNEQQRGDLLAMIATATLAGGTITQLRGAVAAMDALENAVREATIMGEGASAPSLTIVEGD